MTIVLGAALATVEACNDIDDDLPPFSTSPGYTQPVPVGTSDASTIPDSAVADAADAEIDAASEGGEATDAGGIDGATTVDAGIDGTIVITAASDDGG